MSIPTGSTPKKVEARRSERQEKFLEAFRHLGRVDKAAERAGIDRTTVYAWCKVPEFDERFEAARRESMLVLEDEATRRAVEGVDEPVFYLGAECGMVRKYSDTLLIFLLKGGKPERYRERVEHSGDPKRPIVVRRAEELSDDELAAIAAGGGKGEGK